MAKPIALTGGAYQARSVVASAQRSLNLYAEPMPAAEGEPAGMAHYPTPGSTVLAALPEVPLRGIHQANDGTVYAVAGSYVYSINPTTWAFNEIGHITDGLTTPVSMADSGLDLIIVDGSANGWDIILATGELQQIVDPGGLFEGADVVVYLDGIFLFNKKNTPRCYWSLDAKLANSPIGFDPLAQDFGNKVSAGDYLVTLAVARREIYLLGQKTTEIWYHQGLDATGGGSEFAPVQGIFIDHGIAALYSIAQYDNAIFWLARNRQGRGVVMTSAGYQTKRISTYAIEEELRKYATIEDAQGFCYQISGHTFYVLSFPSADHTWVYDVGTQLWHEWCWIDTNGDEHRHRSNCFATINGQLVVGDWQTGSLYKLSNDVYTDDNSTTTGPIKRQRSFPHIVATGRRVFYRELVADVETGTAPKQGPVPDNLLISLDWSDDRGHSYGNPVAQGIGGTSPVLGAGGDYQTSLQWQRLGMTRDRVWRLTWTVNAPTVLQGAWMTAEAADADEPAPQQQQAAE